MRVPKQRFQPLPQGLFSAVSTLESAESAFAAADGGWIADRMMGLGPHLQPQFPLVALPRDQGRQRALMSGGRDHQEREAAGALPTSCGILPDLLQGFFNA
ncbi:hypothetical protein HNR46_000709, partial [Haloferula luteola]